jgi:hypothetical protein
MVTAYRNYGGNAMLKTSIKDLSVEDVEALRTARRNTRESNHRYGERNFMEILLAGSKKLNQKFADSDLYRIDLGDSE